MGTINMAEIILDRFSILEAQRYEIPLPTQSGIYSQHTKDNLDSLVTNLYGTDMAAVLTRAVRGGLPPDAISALMRAFYMAGFIIGSGEDLPPQIVARAAEILNELGGRS